MSPRASAAPPTLVAWLGYGGLIPFVVIAIAVRIDAAHDVFWSHALLCYAACIVSFMGALWWGFAMTLPDIDLRRRNALFACSVVPALIAWIALLLPDRAALLALALTLGALFLMDRRWGRALILPAWFVPLRLKLTLVAVASLLVTALF